MIETLPLFIQLLFIGAILIGLSINILGWIEGDNEYYRGAEYHKTRLILWLTLILIVIIYGG
jgi:ABC-type lipoprotein release transport system permease subunit